MRDHLPDGPEDEEDSEEEEEKAYRSQASAYASLMPKTLFQVSRCVEACVVNDDLTDGPMRGRLVSPAHVGISHACGASP